MRTYVYVDGFNLYYRTLKGTAFKWLNLAALFDRMLPNNDIRAIKYFTARVSARADDPGVVTRQQAYLRALGTLPTVHVIYGKFMVTYPRVPLKTPLPSGQRTVEIIKTEEKGSDVNLATHLLIDGFTDQYDVAVVVSNDTDLVEPIGYVRSGLKKRVGVLCPNGRAAGPLREAATFWRPIWEKHLRQTQFPPEIRDAHGLIHKPPEWL